MQYQRAALRNSPQRGLHEFPRSAWELGKIILILLPIYRDKNSVTEMSACFKIARKVPSGISLGWLGIVV